MNSHIDISDIGKNKLRDLYFADSKHGSYQPVPDTFTDFIPEAKIDPFWRSPVPRIEILKKELTVYPLGAEITEIGANTGFQSICLAQEFPDLQFIAFEGTKSHADFLQLSAELLKISNLEVINEYTSPKEILARYPNSIILDFNVLHHAGSDFSSKKIHSVEGWWQTALPGWFSGVLLNQDYWFSCGYRMGGSNDSELHTPNDPSGFVNRLLSIIEVPENYSVEVWFISSVSGKLVYNPCNELEKLNSLLNAEIEKNSFRGEYFKRPLLRFKRDFRL